MFNPVVTPSFVSQHVLRALALAFCVLTVPIAQAALVDNGDGTVTDSTTQLVWDKCVYGLSGPACVTGTAAWQGNWPDALQQATTANGLNHLGANDWRVPSKKELESLVLRSANNPAIGGAFPNTPITGGTPGAGGQWTSTTYMPYTPVAYYVNFDSGVTDTAMKAPSNLFVRLVRGGQPLAPVDGLQPIVNGTCGSAHTPTPLVASAPGTNLCGLGSTASSVTAGTSAYTWSCAGSNGGTTASCSAGRGYTVTPSAGTGGSISPNTPQVVAYNATPAFTVAPAVGYQIGSVGGTCGGALSGATYATTAVTADCTVAASFTPIFYPITVTSGTGGTANCTPSPVAHGGTVTCTATPGADYTFSGWGGDCTRAGTATTCTLSNVTSAKAVSASFSPVVVSLPITINSGTGGSVSCTPNPVSLGGTVTCTATPGADYTFSGWGGDCTSAGTTITCTLTNVTSAKSVSASFALATAAAPTAIPTLGEWALMALAGLMGLLALAGQGAVGGVRRRQGS